MLVHSSSCAQMSEVPPWSLLDYIDARFVGMLHRRMEGWEYGTGSGGNSAQVSVCASRHLGSYIPLGLRAARSPDVQVIAAVALQPVLHPICASVYPIRTAYQRLHDNIRR